MRKPVRDDLITVVVSPLRAAKVITPEMREIELAFGDLHVAVKLQHIHFPKGGGWSFFECPSCGHRSHTLRRMPDDRIACKACDGLLYACQMSDDKSARIERLTKLLQGKVHNRRRLEDSLSRALIVERMKQLKPWVDQSKSRKAAPTSRPSGSKRS